MSDRPINDEQAPGWDQFLRDQERSNIPRNEQQAFEIYLHEQGIDIDTATLEELKAARTAWKEELGGASLDYDEENEEWCST